MDKPNSTPPLKPMVLDFIKTCFRSICDFAAGQKEVLQNG